MARGYALAGAAVALVAAAFVSGANRPGEDKKDAAGHKTAVFNMTAVMRDFDRAKYQAWLLGKKRERLVKDLVVWRGEYIAIQKELAANPKHPEMEQKSQKMLALARMIEDEHLKITKQLNDDASAIIADLYDKMKAVVDEIAERDGFKLVLAYPDVVTAEELKTRTSSN